MPSVCALFGLVIIAITVTVIASKRFCSISCANCFFGNAKLECLSKDQIEFLYEKGHINLTQMRQVVDSKKTLEEDLKELREGLRTDIQGLREDNEGIREDIRRLRLSAGNERPPDEVITVIQTPPTTKPIGAQGGPPPPPCPSEREDSVDEEPSDKGEPVADDVSQPEMKNENQSAAVVRSKGKSEDSRSFTACVRDCLYFCCVGGDTQADRKARAEYKKIVELYSENT